jgi:hypothetical protein
MPIRCGFDLTPADRSTVDLGALSEYRRIRALILPARNKYFRLHQQVLSIANTYFDTNERRDYVVRLRIDIRNATKGNTRSVGMSTPTVTGYVTGGTEQLYNAENRLLRAAYQKVISLVHPDSSKLRNSQELFQLANAAFHLGDLTYLQELYLTLTFEHDLFWQQSSGLEYVRQELERPTTSLRILQSSPEFRISQLHMTRKFEEARILADRRMDELVLELTAELNSLLT